MSVLSVLDPFPELQKQGATGSRLRGFTKDGEHRACKQCRTALRQQVFVAAYRDVLAAVWKEGSG
jgi:hypothetical protein